MEPLWIFLRPLVFMLPFAFLFGHLAAKQKEKEKEKLKKEILEELAEQQPHQSKEPRPGSDAHYAAWREEQLKKTGKE